MRERRKGVGGREQGRKNRLEIVGSDKVRGSSKSGEVSRGSLADWPHLRQHNHITTHMRTHVDTQRKERT